MTTLFKTIDELIEFVPVSRLFTIENLNPYFQDAADAILIPHVSQALYDRILSKYAAENPQPSALETELFNKMRLIVARFAIVAYLPFGQVTIGDDGITTTGKSESRTAAYDQQITRLSESLLVQGYDALERLLVWLESPLRLDEFTEYKNSDEYQNQQRGLIRRATDFSNIYPISGSRLTFISIHPELMNVEEDKLKPLISRAKYELIKANAALDDDHADLRRAAQKAVVFQAVANVIALQQNIQLDSTGLRVYGTSQNGSQSVKYYRAPTDSERSAALAAAQARADVYWDSVSDILSEINNPDPIYFEREILSSGKIVMF